MIHQQTQTEQTELSTADMANAGAKQAPDPAETQTAATAETAGATDAAQQSTALFAADEAQTFRARWDDIQAGFVDEPRRAVESADTLVAETMKRLAEIFAAERATLEQQWDKGDNISTEDLRLALQRYRSFFSRLLSV
jgi:hypothetical protein